MVDRNKSQTTTQAQVKKIITQFVFLGLSVGGVFVHLLVISCMRKEKQYMKMLLHIRNYEVHKTFIESRALIQALCYVLKSHTVLLSLFANFKFLTY